MFCYCPAVGSAAADVCACVVWVSVLNEDRSVPVNYTGVFENENGWWYVKDSKVDFHYTGLADNQYGTWYIVNGKVKFSYSGTVDFDGQTFTVEKGKVIA